MSGEFTCHIDHKRLRRSRHIKLLPFLPQPKSAKFWGVCEVSGGCLEGVWKVCPCFRAKKEVL